jgi:2-dehydro-3-deoxygluconokinase
MRAVLVGEPMLELSRSGEDWRLGYGGDTLNTAIHLARLGLDTAYLTAIGGDPLSAGLCDAWRAEGLDCRFVLTDPARTTGLYAISTDAAGERSFSYWRDTSAARATFAHPGVDAALREAGSTELLAFSLISLAILPDEGREALLNLAQCVRANGGRVAFDGNYRARLWPDPATARHWRDRAIACADIGLPTLEDEQAMGASDVAGVAAHWQSLGCMETAVKLGEHGCLLADGTLVAPPRVLQPVDTSGAGDAFNAGYLAARLNGVGLVDAALAGHDLAGWCVMHRGAIPPGSPNILQESTKTP